MRSRSVPKVLCEILLTSSTTCFTTLGERLMLEKSPRRTQLLKVSPLSSSACKASSSAALSFVPGCSTSLSHRAASGTKGAPLYMLGSLTKACISSSSVIPLSSAILYNRCCSSTNFSPMKRRKTSVSRRSRLSLSEALLRKYSRQLNSMVSRLGIPASSFFFFLAMVVGSLYQLIFCGGDKYSHLYI